MKIQFDMPPTSAQQSNGVAVRYAAAKRNVPRWRWYLLLALVILPPLYFATRFALAFWWETAPALVQIDRTSVRAGVAGWVKAVPKEGQRVEEGQLLLDVRPPVEAPPVEVQAPRPADPGRPGRIAAARSAAELAQRQLALRQQRLATLKRLLDNGAATRGEVDTAAAQVLAAQAELAQARADLAGLQADDAEPPAPPAPPAPEPARQGPSAPFSGEVVRVWVRVGEWVHRDSEVAVLQSEAAPYVRAFVDAGRSRYAQVGRTATLRFFDGGRVAAEVVAVEPEAARLPQERVAPLSPRSQSIVVILRPLQALEPRHRIHQLPLDVRFDHLW